MRVSRCAECSQMSSLHLLTLRLLTTARGAPQFRLSRSSTDPVTSIVEPFARDWGVVAFTRLVGILTVFGTQRGVLKFWIAKHFAILGLTRVVRVHRRRARVLLRNVMLIVL